MAGVKPHVLLCPDKDKLTVQDEGIKEAEPGKKMGAEWPLLDIPR